MSAIAQKVSEVMRRIAAAAEQSGRRAKDITLVAATKTVPKSTVDMLAETGITDVGENRADEFIEKYDARIPLRRHFIGALQTNKVKYLVGKCHLIQSVDRHSLIDEIDRLSKKHGTVTDVLLEVNVGREPSKSGVLPEQLPELLSYALGAEGLRVRGIMTVLPIGAADELYRITHGLYCSVRERVPTAEVLSMGMSGDYEKAILHGATMVRVGSAIFGERKITQ